jgi:hypothetical protein
MGFLKKLFGLSAAPARRDDNDPNALILYVKVRKCGAIARLRVDMRNDLSLDDDGETYVVRKQVVDNVCYGSAEIELHFDANHKESSRNATDGEFVTRDDWEQQERLRIAPHDNNT